MGLLLRINVDAPDDVLRDYGAGAKLYWARDDASAIGAFTDASGSTAIVSGQTQYEIFDATGQDGHWYRTRVGNTGGTAFSAWDGPFQGGAVQAYATVDDLRKEIRVGDDRANLLADLLIDASAWLDAETGRKEYGFYRHPAVSGTETRTYHLPADIDRLDEEIVSLDQVEYALGTNEAYAVLDAAGWELEPSTVDGLPYSGLVLNGLGTLTRFVSGYHTVRLTGVFGFATVPRLIRRATITLAREMYEEGPGGGTVGLEFGRLPVVVQSAVKAFRRRTYAHI